MESRRAVIRPWIHARPGSVCASEEPLPGTCGPSCTTEVNRGRASGKLAHRTSHTKEDKDTPPPREQRANTTSPCMALVALCRRIGITPKALIRGCPRSCPCLEKKTDGRRVQVRSLSRCTTKAPSKGGISMKLGIIPENILERVALAAGVVPRPMLDTLVAMLLARTIMAPTKLRIFEPLASVPLPAQHGATPRRPHPPPTQNLLTPR